MCNTTADFVNAILHYKRTYKIFTKTKLNPIQCSKFIMYK